MYMDNFKFISINKITCGVVLDVEVVDARMLVLVLSELVGRVVVAVKGGGTEL